MGLELITQHQPAYRKYKPEVNILNNTKAVFSFGRMNPPTKGHAHLIIYGDSYAGSLKADYFLFPSPSIDKIPKSGVKNPETSKNPLPHSTKIAILRRLFPLINTIEDASVYSPQQVIEYLKSRGYTQISFVVGSDRVTTFQERWLPYALEEVEFAEVISAGARDPDADGVEGMSASKARACVLDGDRDGFVNAVGWRNREFMHDMYAEVRKGMGIIDE